MGDLNKVVQKKIAIIGGGISGIACSWQLRGQPFDVHLFEGHSQLGGHANTVPFTGNHTTVNVDTGFVVFDEETYPGFTNFLRALDVDTFPTDMSFGVSEDNGKFEWGSHCLRSFICRPIHLFYPWFWRLVFDIVRFNLFATDVLDENSTEVYDSESESISQRDYESIGRYLARNRYSEQFKRYYIIPMIAAPWCIDPDKVDQNFPAKFLIHFMSRHNLLNTVTRTLKWRTIKNGSRSYVNKYLQSVPSNHFIHLSTPIRAVSRISSGQIRVSTSSGREEDFDHAVFATNADEALRMLGQSATSTELKLLSPFKTSQNICVLHSDTSLLPKRPNAQVSWNCIMRSPSFSSDCRVERNQDEAKPLLRSKVDQIGPDSAERISITFDMNRLQNIPAPGVQGSPGRVLVSMNPIIMPESVQSFHVYRTPMFTAESVAAAERLATINGTARISFAGAWMGYGFHEDGFMAGVIAAEGLIKGIPPGIKMSALQGQKIQRGVSILITKKLIVAMQFLLEKLEDFIR